MSFYLYNVSKVSLAAAIASAGALGPFSSDPPGELDVLWHDGYPLSMDGAQVGILEEPDEVGLGCLLESHDGGALETKIGFEVLDGRFPSRDAGRAAS